MKLSTYLAVDLNILILLAIIYGIYFSQKQIKIPKSLYLVLTIAIIYATYLAALGFSIAMDDAYRFYVPLTPVLIIALILSWQSVNIKLVLKKNLVFVLIALMVVARGGDLWYMWHRDLNLGLYLYCISGKSVAEGIQTGHIAAGKWLKQNVPSNSTIVLFDAGAIPYYSQLTTIDTWSLNDWPMINFHLRLRELGASKEKGKIESEMRSYVLNRNPDFIVEDNIGLLSDPAVQNNFERVGPDFIYLDIVQRKPTRNPFTSCHPSSSYVIKIWQRIR